jgi:hypothetical protein
MLRLLLFWLSLLRCISADSWAFSSTSGVVSLAVYAFKLVCALVRAVFVFVFTSTAEAGKVVWAVEDTVAEFLAFEALEDGAAAFGAEFGESE